MVRRDELTDAQFAMIEDLLPENGRRGAQWNDHRMTLGGIFRLLHTGAQWRKVPQRYRKWKSVYDRFRRWCKDHTIDWVLERLHLRLDEAGRIDRELWCIDATSTRASRAAAGARRVGPQGEPSGHALGRSRGGFGTKQHLIFDGHGIRLSVSASPGQAHESRHGEPAPEAVRLVRPGRRRPKRLAGDKG